MKTAREAFIDAAWRESFARAGLNSFADFWELGSGQVEAGNQARGGWSDVRRAEIIGPDGSSATIFIKRQENFRTRTAFGRSIPVAQREFTMMQRLRAEGIPATQPIYFAVAPAEAGWRAVLVTIGLRDFIEWKELEDAWRERRLQRGRARWNAIRAAGELMGKLHRAGLRHGSLYPKHIFLRDYGKAPAACFIDLEKTKSNCFGLIGVKRDFSTFVSRCDWSATDKWRFVLAYCGSRRATSHARKLFKFVRELDRR